MPTRVGGGGGTARRLPSINRLHRPPARDAAGAFRSWQVPCRGVRGARLRRFSRRWSPTFGNAAAARRAAGGAHAHRPAPTACGASGRTGAVVVWRAARREWSALRVACGEGFGVKQRRQLTPPQNANRSTTRTTTTNGSPDESDKWLAAKQVSEPRVPRVRAAARCGVPGSGTPPIVSRSPFSVPGRVRDRAVERFRSRERQEQRRRHGQPSQSTGE